MNLSMAAKKTAQIDSQLLKAATSSIRAINNQVRLRIIQLLHEKGKLNVTGIYKAISQTQSKTSLHLTILRKENFVTTEKEGTIIYYSINYHTIKRFLKTISQL
jgi:ArsR family transcriptional regulator